MGKDKDTGAENRLGDTAREGEAGTSGESSPEVYTLPCVKQVACGKLLYHTGRSAQGPAMT